MRLMSILVPTRFPFSVLISGGGGGLRAEGAGVRAAMEMGWLGSWCNCAAADADGGDNGNAIIITLIIIIINAIIISRFTIITMLVMIAIKKKTSK